MFCFSSAVSQDLIKDETLRDDLKFYFMNPCEKYRARQHVPWKLGVQILKIVMITTQVCTLGLRYIRKDDPPRECLLLGLSPRHVALCNNGDIGVGGSYITSVCVFVNRRG